jgi:glutathione synthase/RimK-type ligase-like ATP-grasp enzyme
MLDIVILTEKKYVNAVASEGDWYTKNVLEEDNLVLQAFEKRGWSAKIKAWDDPDFDWTQTKHVMFRTIWDYFHRFKEFSVWLAETASKTIMINSIEQILWNVDKHYLEDLLDGGINVPETLFIRKGDERSLQDLHDDMGWEETVVKPCISGAGRHTYKLDSDNIIDFEDIYQELIAQEDMMLQPFLELVPEKGEIAFMMMGGEFTHAVLKKAKEGDFRVQDDFGGTVDDYTPTEEEIVFAENAIKSVSPLPAYARVDAVWDNEGNLCVSELELIEPELWFRKHPEAADVLADYVIREYSE